MRLIGILAVTLLFTAASPALGQSFPPVDEADRDPGLERVRNRLLTAFESRDVEAAARDIHPMIENRVTGETGRDAFVAWLNAETDRWSELHDLMSRGGRMVRNGDFVAPYTATIDLGGRDPVTTGIVTGSEVRVRSQPSLNGGVIGEETFTLVTVPSWHPDFSGEPVAASWLRVQTPDGDEGFIFKRFVAPVATYVLRFVEVRGIWWLKEIDSNFE